MRERILIIDDSEQNLAILVELLGDRYEVETGRTGEECLRKVHDFAPDIVLLDITMPGMDGYETCRHIKSAPYGTLTDVILVSAKGSTEARLAGYEAGADDFLAKPFDHDELLAKLRIHFRLRHSLLQLAAARGELAVHNERLEDEVRRRTAEIIATRDMTVFALARLTESRDSETGEHLERMRAYAQILAETLGESGPYASTIDSAFIEDVYRSTPLHDIGKVGIPDAILLKPDRLNAVEFEIMKRHTIIGAETLASANRHNGSGGFLEMATRIARSHHERFDGTGYPDGLCGTAIPLVARIVAVADVYDALTSVRVYKEAYTPLVAQSMIEQSAGSHFDPRVVDAFRACAGRFIEVRERLEACASDSPLAAPMPSARIDREPALAGRTSA